MTDSGLTPHERDRQELAERFAHAEQTRRAAAEELLDSIDPPESIESLIERSSLGSEQARRARKRVPLAQGQEMARRAAALRRPATEDDR